MAVVEVIAVAWAVAITSLATITVALQRISLAKTRATTVAGTTTEVVAAASTDKRAVATASATTIAAIEASVAVVVVIKTETMVVRVVTTEEAPTRIVTNLSTSMEEEVAIARGNPTTSTVVTTQGRTMA